MPTITQERLDALLDAEKKLMYLEAAGVDNWQGYDDAMEMMEQADG